MESVNECGDAIITHFEYEDQASDQTSVSMRISKEIQTERAEVVLLFKLFSFTENNIIVSASKINSS